MAGKTYRVSEDGWSLSISFPAALPGRELENYFGVVTDDDEVVGVGLFSLEAQCNGEVSDDREAWPGEATAALNVMGVVLGRFMATARILMPWIAGWELVPKPEFVSARIRETGEGVQFENPPQHGRSHRTVVGAAPLDEDTFIRSLRDDAIPDLSDRFLAEARYLAHFSAHYAPEQAVVLAAIACEAKVQRALRAGASDEVRPLLQQVVRRLKWEELFTETAENVLAKSLGGEVFYRDLKKLYEVRNGVVHRAASVSQEEAERLVRAAYQAARVIDGWGRPSSKG
jgi:hypothetical protein